MKTPDTVMNSSARPRPRSRFGKVDVRYVAWFSLFVLAGGVATLYPFFFLGCLAAAAVLGICWGTFVFLGRVGLELWQFVALITLSGYLVLNYGFENVALHVGSFPILITYGMMYASLALAIFAHRDLVAKAVREPALVCVLAVLGLSVF